MMRSIRQIFLRMKLISLFAIFSVTTTASASSISVNYYDALGRVKAVCNATDSAGDLSRYQFDAASNRTLYSHERTEIYLPAGTSILSPNGNYIFDMQGDCNLVLYVKSGSTWVWANWASGTSGTNATLAAFQADGNLVVYSPSGALWASGTQNHCATLAVQNDGNVVISDVEGNVLWNTGTGGH